MEIQREYEKWRCRTYQTIFTQKQIRRKIREKVKKIVKERWKEAVLKSLAGLAVR